MTRICYKTTKFHSSTLDMIAKANRIIADYQEQGFALTVRQLYYQIVAHDLFPADRTWKWTGSAWVRDPKGTKNAQPNYKFLVQTLNDARLAGLIDWEALEDRTRNLMSLQHEDDAKSATRRMLDNYRHDKWDKGQPFRIEVWVEKDALLGVIEPACNELDVPFFSCRGYNSQSEQWRAGIRLASYIQDGFSPVILHFGDHDPSGIDMSRDNEERLDMFTNFHAGQGIILERLALNMDQIEQYNPPPNPVKLTDSRAEGYGQEHGSESWELDALDPPVIAGLIKDGVMKYRDEEAWQKALDYEAAERGKLADVLKWWPAVMDFVKGEWP